VTAAESITAAKNFARGVVLPAAARAAVFAVFLAVVFFVAGWVAYSGIAALLLSGANSGLRAVVALLVVVLYTCAGGVVGLIWGAASGIARKLARAEGLVHELTVSITSRILERVPFGHQGISTDEFIGYVDREINAAESPNAGAGVVASAGMIGRRILRRFLPIVRNLLAVHFVKDLQSKGDSMVTSAAVERFMREKMVGLASKFVRLKLYAIRKLAIVAAGVVIFIPVVLLLFRAAR
jgi:hypothetical protein